MFSKHSSSSIHLNSSFPLDLVVRVTKKNLRYRHLFLPWALRGGRVEFAAALEHFPKPPIFQKRGIFGGYFTQSPMKYHWRMACTSVTGAFTAARTFCKLENNWPPKAVEATNGMVLLAMISIKMHIKVRINIPGENTEQYCPFKKIQMYQNENTDAPIGKTS